MNKLKTLFLSILIGSFAGAIASFAFSSPGSNQPPNGGPTFWLLNSTNMYYQGGSVGIGTSTPRNILNISNTTAGSNIFFDIDASTSSNAGMRTYSGGSQINFFGKSAGYNNATVVDANGGYLILNPSGTNVGIGTASPAAKMDVAGGIKMANDTDVCNASKAGTIRWTGTSFQGCTGAAWGNFLSPSDGTTQARAGRTCKTLLDNGYSTGSGAYWIDPDNDGDTSNAFQIYCDMANQGGGWTLVVGIDGANTSHQNTAAVTPGNLTSATGKGKLSDATISQIKLGTSPAYRLTCASVVGYFQTSCAFAATTDASGACTAESYTYPPSSYGTAQYVQGSIRTLADGSNSTANRLIYGYTGAGGPSNNGSNGVVVIYY